MSATQPTLPTLRDWHEPQDVKPYDLARTIAEANRNGFDAVGLTVLKPSGYRVRFQRMPAASRTPTCPEVVRNLLPIRPRMGVWCHTTIRASETKFEI